ncbi:MAG TPA: two-component regulator propeller domain-containing protein, partial [Pyrinomonadaceae bacterium]|nr:two-component regulator propeller domain-containing protein [Pyrinomonadaceae bacterium]
MGIQILLHKVKRADRRRTPAIALGILLACCSCAFALNPSLDVNQYAHTAWKVGEGLPSGTIRAIAQTPDGYLWLGTEFGLLRFDGVRAVPWQPPSGERLTSSDIRSLQGARDGRLWIGTYRGLASWKDGKLTHYPELDEQIIEALLEDREGTIWVAGWTTSTGRLCRIHSGNIQCHGEDGRFGSGVTPLYEDSGGNVWAGGMNGLWRWKPGPPELYPMPDPAQRIYALVESDDGGLLVAQHKGITKLRNGKSEAYPLPAGFQPHRLLRDRDGSLWIGALVDRGLLHIHRGRTDQFTHAEGLSSRSVTSFFEDREGNIWVATADGLDRFREFAIPTFSVQQGFSSGGVFSILAARDGSLWLGTSDGLNRWINGQITVYRYPGLAAVSSGPAPSGFAAGREADSTPIIREITDSGLPDKAHLLYQDARGQMWVGTQSGVAFLKSDRFVPVASIPYGIVFSFTDDGAGNLWMSHQEGLFRLLQERVVERVPWAQLGRKEPAKAVFHDAVQGGLWLGFRDGGAAYFKEGQLRALYTGADGLGEGEVRSFYFDRNGTLWAATEGGLSRIKDGRVLTLTTQNGLPCNTVHWMMEDDADSVWLYTACGLVRIGWSEVNAWASHPKQTIHVTVFDRSDGVSSHRFTSLNSGVAKSADGKVWFVRGGGVSVLDPHHLAFNELPPPVHIEQVTADDKIYDATNGLRLPPRIRNLEIDYTALSFVAPEKVRFRYMLEGQD